MPEIRVAIIGVGNSACALIQGTQYYKNAKETETVPGLMHVNYGGYHIRDLKFVAAFEVNKDKIGKDLSDAIWVKRQEASLTAPHPTCENLLTFTMTAKPLKKAS
jgi:myo-inositol-1-phosphate synthase